MATLVETSSSLGRQLRIGWEKLSLMQKAPIIAVSLAVFAGLIVLAFRAGNPDYAVLFANLNQADAGEVVQALRESGVKYKLDQGGTAILVPSSDVYQLRLDLASEGLPRGGVVGFEIFQQMSFGQTDFERNVKYVWALQGELTRTIREIDAISDARVHVALPERTSFLRDQGNPTASVVLWFNQGMRLSPSQVEGITYLVARSIEGLKPEDVTVVDNMGNRLSQSVGSGTGNALAGNAIIERLQIKQAFEGDMEQRLQSLLDKIFGIGKTVVHVNAELNFDSEEETIEIYEPATEGGLIRTQMVEETSEPALLPGGVVGTLTNQIQSQLVGDTPDELILPDANQLQAQPAATGNYQRRSSSVAYDHNRTVRYRVAAPGKVTQLSVAVVVDGELTPQETDEIRTTMLAAVGGGPDSETAPIVSVESRTFANQQPLWEPLAPVSAPSGTTVNLPLWAGVGLFALAMLGLVLRMSRRKEQVEEQVDVSAAQIAATSELASRATKAEKDTMQQKREIEVLAKQRPEEFANLVRTWLSEESK